jgi:hypothetical protein
VHAHKRPRISRHALCCCTNNKQHRWQQQQQLLLLQLEPVLQLVVHFSVRCVYVLLCVVLCVEGIMKVNLAGPGLTETVKTLWRKPATA